MTDTSFDEIADEFKSRTKTMIWCNVATVDSLGRPRSRILHPIWEGSTGWIMTRRESFKSKHLKQNPHMSLAYVSDIAKPVYVECIATWEENPAEKARLWHHVKALPEPVGFDPTPLFGSIDSPGYGLLKLTPWRIELYSFPTDKQVWRS